MTTGTDLIAAERRRQIDEEGWTPDHDAEHTSGQLARAASCYAMPEPTRIMVGWSINDQRRPRDWPWHPDYWKPTPDDRIRELVKAGALIAAEIDRLHAVSVPALSGEETER